MKRQIKIYLPKLLLYIMGLFILGLAISIVLRTKIGSGAWDAVSYNLHMLTNQKITVGTAGQIIGIILLSIILIYRRQLKYAFTLIPILITGFFIDLWNLIILKNFFINELYAQILFFALAVFLLPFALSLMIQSGLSSMVFDEFTYVLMDFFKAKSFTLVRICFEIFAVILAISFGLIAGGQLYEVKYGTIVMAFTIGPLIDLYLNLYKKMFSKKVVELEE